MKNLIFIIVGLLVLMTCQTKKEVTPAISKIEIVTSKFKVQEPMKVEYEATTRGYYSKITLENNVVSVSNDRNNVEKPQTANLSSSDKYEIDNLLKNLNPESLTTLKGATEKRFYDGAPHANLKITKNAKSYETEGFDHGFPPKEIEKLVTKLVSFSEKK